MNMYYIMNIENICDIIKNKTNINNIFVGKSTYNYETSNPAEDLLGCNIVKNTNTKYTILKLKDEDDNKLIAECRFCIISDNIGYIHSIEVDKDIQNNKIGTSIIKYIIKNISSNKIYIYPTNKVIKHICRKCKFKPVNKPENWYYLNNI